MLVISTTNELGLTIGKEYNAVTASAFGDDIDECWLYNDLGIFIRLFHNSFMTKKQFDRVNKLTTLLQ